MGTGAPETQEVELDRTLADLYKIDNKDGVVPDLTFLIPNGSRSLSSGLPLSTKYAYQAPRADKLPDDIMARVCLGVGPQYMSFMAGKMKINLFDPDKHKNEPNGDEQYRVHQLDALKIYEQLSEHQRPVLDFVHSAAEVNCEDGQKVAFLTPLDCFADLPQHMNPDIHYQLLSKRELAIANLPTPETTLVDCELKHEEIDDTDRVRAEAERMTSFVDDGVPPFVVKLPQGLAGQGVYLIKNDQDKQQLLQTFDQEVEKMILTINENNEHLHVANLVIQQMIQGPAVALSFFITKAGNAIFTSCVEQDIDSKGAWAGAVINYEQQDALEMQYKETMEQIAAYVYSRGYWGPMGADIMTDTNGKQLVIDLNVRVTGSYVLGFLKTHLMVKRNLKFAALLYPLNQKGTRTDFEKAFRADIDSGRLLVVGWCHGRAGPWGLVKYSVAAVVAAAESAQELRDLCNKVNDRRLRK